MAEQTTASIIVLSKNNPKQGRMNLCFVFSGSYFNVFVGTFSGSYCNVFVGVNAQQDT
jgi:hypothetical protein